MKFADGYKTQIISTDVEKWLEDGVSYTYDAILKWNGIRFATNPQSFPRRNETNVIKSQNEWDNHYTKDIKCNYYSIQLTRPIEIDSLDIFNIDIQFTKMILAHGENEGLSRDLQFYLHCAAMRTIIFNSKLLNFFYY